MMRASKAFALAALLVIGCTHGNAEQAVQAAAPVAVRLADVTVAEVAEPITATGSVGAKEELTLGFKIGGVVARVAVNAGETVQAGQTLAALDLREIDAAVARAQSGAARAEREFARAQRLYADSVVALAQLQDAETALEVARADLETARFNRRYAVIVAPSAGVVLRRAAEPGEMVGAGATVLVLGSRSRGTVLRVGLPDRDAVRVRAGSRAVVRFDALPDRSYDGVVSEIGAAIDGSTGTVSVEITLAGGDRLFSGLVGTAEIEPAAMVSATLVPVEAVLEADAAQGTVFTLARDGVSAQRHVVRIGHLAGNRVVVTSGLEGVRQVITAGAAYLNEGTKVKVVQ